MALDGAFLSIIVQDIRTRCLGARVEKISQPARDCIIVSLHTKSGSEKLLVSCAASGARLHFTSLSYENPQSPPMFCMLLRKHLSGGRLTDVRQIGRDRVIFLDFEVMNELSDRVTISLCAEITGHNSNIILINQNGAIIDSARRIGTDVSSVRLVLPGVKYSPPPQQNRLDMFERSDDEIKNDFASSPQLAPDKALLSLYCGLSPIVCREAAFYALRGRDVMCQSLTSDELTRFIFFIHEMKKHLISPSPCAVFDMGGKPKDFSFIPIRQYGGSLITREYEDAHKLLDDFYRERDRVERVRQISGDLLKTVVNISDRIERKLANQRLDLQKCKDKDRLKKFGDIIYANLSCIGRAQSSVTLVDFYDQAQSEVEITLDPRLSPVQNAQKYYNEYRKSAVAEKKLAELIKSGEEELCYIESVFDLLSRASGEAELSDIRAELYEQRYIKKSGGKKRMKTTLPYLKFFTSDGFTVLCGRNNLQNDKLTLHGCAKNDIWFHTQKIPGSHTVLITDGKVPTDAALFEAASIAAYNSRARASSKVAVDYTAVKNVKKPSGAKPGMVIYDNYKTAVVTPDQSLCDRLFAR